MKKILLIITVCLIGLSSYGQSWVKISYTPKFMGQTWTLGNALFSDFVRNSDTTGISVATDSANIFVRGNSFVMEKNSISNASGSKISLSESGVFGSTQIGTKSNYILIEEGAVNPIQFTGNALFNDPVTMSGGFIMGNDTVTNIIPLDSATGNIANGTTFLDSIFSSRFIGKRIGLNSLTTNSKLDVFGSYSLGKDMFVFCDKSSNLNTTTFAESIDSSAFSLTFSPLGKPVLLLKGKSPTAASQTNNIFHIDTLGNFVFSIQSSNIGNKYVFNNLSAGYFYNYSASTGYIFSNNYIAGVGGRIILAQNTGLAMADNRRLGSVEGGGSYTTGNDKGTPSAYICFTTEGTWSSTTDRGSRFETWTCPDGHGTVTQRVNIAGGKKLSDNTPTSLFTFAPVGATVNSSKVDTTISMKIDFSYITSDGTDSQVENGIIFIQGYVKDGAGTTNITVSPTAQSVSTGTLAIITPTSAWNNSSKVFTIAIGWDSSLNQTGMANYEIHNYGYGTITHVP